MADPSELKTETVRVDLGASSAPPAEPNVKQTVRIQVPVREPASNPQPFSSSESAISSVPTARNPVTTIESHIKSSSLIWWILLGVSALILIIQIWIYLS